MSQDFNDPEIFADFVIEAKEHLETIEPNLLELEKSPDNLALLNEIFRPMHSLKGASGFLGLNIINRLAHRAENIMEELRKGAMPATPEIMDVILTSTDALRQLVDNLEATGTEGDVDIEPIVQTLDALLEGGGRIAAESNHAQPEPEEPAQENPVVPEKPVAQNAGESEEAASTPEVAENNPSDAENDKDGDETPPVDLESYKLTTFGEGHLNDFLEEAVDNIANLNDSLLQLEQDPTKGGELVNDTFRYFHNLKGNSGIIGFKELNGLTHEAETLLNKVRKGELPSSHGMIDLLLSAVDTIEALVNRIDVDSGEVTPFETARLVSRLQKAVEEGVPDPEPATAPEPEPAVEPANAPEASADAAPPADDLDVDPEDINIFEGTIRQQFQNIDIALKELGDNSDQSDFVDGLYRSLITVQNSSAYMGMEEVKVYAQRTAQLVDQARSAGLPFDAMLDILRQECSIIRDMVDKEIETLKAALSSALKGAEPSAPADQAPEPASEAKTAASQEAAPEPKKQDQPEKTEAEPPKAQEPKSGQPEEQQAKAAPKTGAQKTDAPETKQEDKAPEAKAAPKSVAAAPASKPAAAAKPPVRTAAPPAQGGAAQNKPKVSSTIRVDHEKLDHLMNLIGELIINRNRFAMLARNLEDDNADVSVIAHNLTETTYAMARISDDLQDTIMKVRMVPVQTVFSRFPRLVRDLSRKSGKQVELITEGEETELDKSVVEVIGDPLVHLIRNSVDHGIENEEVRTAANKVPKGTVWLRAYHRGNSVAIEVEDDGKGIDPEKMREVGVRKGIITAEEAKNLDDREAMELIFAPGFSGAEKVTDISGRGVGMDVVRTNIKNLKGSVNIHSEVGKGTKFTLVLPLTLAIIDALMVKVEGQLFAIPLDAVSETTKIEASKLTDVNNRKAVTLRGEVLGIVDLRELLGMMPKDPPDEILSVLVIHDNDRRLGIVVDRLLERQEIVIKSLGEYLGDQRGLSGATIMGDGSVVLILDPHEIYLMATSKAI